MELELSPLSLAAVDGLRNPTAANFIEASHSNVYSSRTFN
jgi:hypothetical protein